MAIYVSKGPSIFSRGRYRVPTDDRPRTTANRPVAGVLGSATCQTSDLRNAETSPPMNHRLHAMVRGRPNQWAARTEPPGRCWRCTGRSRTRPTELSDTATSRHRLRLRAVHDGRTYDPSDDLRWRLLKSFRRFVRVISRSGWHNLLQAVPPMRRRSDDHCRRRGLPGPRS